MDHPISRSAVAGVLLAGLLALAPGAQAGVIRGTVERAAPRVTHVARPNAYPGRANAMPHAPGAAEGGVDETVVWLERLPAGMTVPPPRGPHPTLEQKQQRFVPRVLALQAGTTVDFPNRDPIYHNVFSVSPARRFDLGKYREGQSRSVRFDKPGVIRVFCDIHSDMAAYILVLPHHAFARADAAGRFELPAMPAGSYSLKVWHPDGADFAVPVRVPDEGDVAVAVKV